MARTALAQATSFAHLIGLGKPAQAAAPQAAEDDERKQRDNESDEDYKDRIKKLDDKEDEAKAEEQRKKDEEAAKAKKARGSDDDDADDENDPKASAARRRERARCAAIFSAEGAGRRPDVAAHLAFNTNLPRSAAIETLDAVSSGHRDATVPVQVVVQSATPPQQTLRGRMAQEPKYEVGTEDEPKPTASAETFAQKVIAADAKRRGEKT